MFWHQRVAEGAEGLRAKRVFGGSAADWTKFPVRRNPGPRPPGTPKSPLRCGVRRRRGIRRSRVERSVDPVARDPVAEAPGPSIAGALGQLVADGRALMAGVHRLDPIRSDGDRVGRLQRALDLHAVGPKDVLAFVRQLFDRSRSQLLPGLEAQRVGADRRIDLLRVRQLPVPEILVLHVAKQRRSFVVGVEVIPGENGSRVVEVEMDVVIIASQ